MVPEGSFLLVRANASFHAAVIDGYEETERVLCVDESLPAGDGYHFILFAPCGSDIAATHRILRLTVYEKSGSRHEDAPLLYLKNVENPPALTGFDRNDLMLVNHLFLSTNGRGSMCRANVRWGQLDSKYDALLAANLDPLFPQDRRIMFSRCRAWIVYQGYSQEVCFDSLSEFWTQGNTGFWIYQIPTGQGQRIDLQITVAMAERENAVQLAFCRLPANGDSDMLANGEAVQLILRPDIEDRNFHETTKAYTGPEHTWPAATTVEADRFVFAPAPDRTLTLRITSGEFVSQPEWHYMVHHIAEKERGLDPDSDLWSPGYFSAHLKGSETVCLDACVDALPSMSVSTSEIVSTQRSNDEAGLEASLNNAIDAFIVKHGRLKSVIAGYPWFLDWGRDSLIFSRSLIQTGRTIEAGEIIKLFGGFEDGGTLPNMLHGGHAANRNTSDAPLWFAVACADLIRKEKSGAFLYEKCGSRTVRDILLSIGHAYIEGTTNHIKMDSASSLIYSPACFTWMDTDHPACTPRRGYCIEIQALWHASLSLLASIEAGGKHNWKTLAVNVEQSIRELFVLKEGYLADCLHAAPGETAQKGVCDDALRPNQLLAVTLGAMTDQKTCQSILDACQAPSDSRCYPKPGGCPHDLSA